MVRRREVLFRDDGSNDGSNTERVQRERVQREKRRYTRRDANLLQSEMNESNSILLRVKTKDLFFFFFSFILTFLPPPKPEEDILP